MSGNNPSPFADMLEHSGQMGEQLRNHNWSLSPVGAPETWPQSLRTTLGIILNAKFPMILFWGPDALVFYNDAYIPAIPSRFAHPDVIGRPARETWTERWAITVAPIVDKVRAGGGPIWFDDMPIPSRDDDHTETYWTGSYSQVLDETGRPAGVLVTCCDTTDKVLHLRRAGESERQLRNIIRQSPAGIIVLEGPDFVVSNVNAAYLAIVQHTEAKLLGKPFFDIFPELNDTIRPLLERVLRTGIAYYGYEYPVNLIRNDRPDTAYFTFVYQPLRTGDDQVTGVMAVATEVTHTVKARQELAASEKTFRTIFMHSAMAMAILHGPDHIIHLANEALLTRIWHKREADIIGKRLVDVFPELSGQKYPALLDEVYKTGKTYKETESLAYIQGDKGMMAYYLDFDYSPMLDTEGNVWGVMVTAYDMTEKVETRKKIEEAEQRAREAMISLEEKVRERTADLQRSNLLLERSNDDLLQFAHVASHDLKEPVRKISIYGRRLQDEYADTLQPPARTYLAKIQSATSRVLEMISSILRYSALPGSEEPYQPVDLNRVLDQIEEDLEIPIHTKHAILTRSKLPVISALPDLIYQLFYNLINNSLKFAKQHQPPRISVTWEHIDLDGRPGNRFYVDDNGIGFDENDAITIFSTFKRLHPKDKYEGTGLGLALCKRIVERHGGRIWASARVNDGAHFTIDLPVN